MPEVMKTIDIQLLFIHTQTKSYATTHFVYIFLLDSFDQRDQGFHLKLKELISNIQLDQ